MGQRHNRRRTRLRPRNRNTIPTTFESKLSLSDFDTPSVPSSLGLLKTTSVCDWRDSSSRSLAPTWHYGYVTWQTRDRSLRPETEQYRLFGGEPGDDVGLCYRMLEYFGGLDYIDS